MNVPKVIHTRQRKAPLRGARLCYRTAHQAAHTCKESRNANRMATTSCEEIQQLLARHAAESCGMYECWHVCSHGRGRKGLAEPTGAAGGRAQDDGRPGGRPMADLGFLASFLGELS